MSGSRVKNPGMMLRCMDSPRFPENLVTGSVFRLVLTTSLLAAALLARADTVHTLAGQSFEGEVQLEHDTLVVTRTGEAPVRVAFTNLSSLIMKPPASEVKSDVKPDWITAKVGSLGECVFTEQADDLLLRSTGLGGFRAKTDGLFFVHQNLEGDGELTASLTGLPAQQDWAVAGLAIREDLTETTRGATVLAKGGQTGALYLRETPKKLRTRRVPGLTSPCWLKLTRLGDQVTTYQSSDGQHWKLLESALIPMERKVLAGLIGGSRKGLATNEAHFSSVKLVQSAHRGPFLPRVVLANGNVLSAQVTAADTTAVRCDALGQALSISTINVARLEFQPLVPELAARLRPGRTGVLLAGGDFVDGEFNGIADGRVRISSVLFGLRTYAVGREAVAVAVRDGSTPPPMRFAVKLTNGSMLAANALASRAGAVVIDDGWLRGLRVPATELREVRRNVREPGGK